VGDGAVASIILPQLRQNRASPLFSVPQDGHCAMIVPFLDSDWPVPPMSLTDPA
jgi:hypothetical protein